MSLRQLSMAQGAKGGRGTLMPQQIGLPGYRRTRQPDIRWRASEKFEADRHRDVQLGDRWMDAMSVDYSCLFPTGMLNIGLHPQKEMEVDLCWAYNRWVTEKVLPEIRRGACFRCCACRSQIPTKRCGTSRPSATANGVGGFMITNRTHPAGVRQRLYEGLSRHRGTRASCCRSTRPSTGAKNVFRGCKPASSRCMRSGFHSTTSSTAPTGSSTACLSASPSYR